MSEEKEKPTDVEALPDERFGPSQSPITATLEAACWHRDANIGSPFKA